MRLPGLDTSQSQGANRYHVEAAWLAPQAMHDHPERLVDLEARLNAHIDNDEFVQNAQFVARLMRGSGMLSRLIRQSVPDLESTLASLRA